MRYRVAAVGRLRRGFYRDGCGHYLRRLQAFGRAEVVEVREGKGDDPARTRQTEGQALLGAAEGRTVALDERGTALASSDIARRLDALELAGDSSLTLLIGGPEGLDQSVREQADEMWSLSRLTLPHEMARLVILEQLYRAETIRSGHPYHRE